MSWFYQLYSTPCPTLFMLRISLLQGRTGTNFCPDVTQTNSQHKIQTITITHCTCQVVILFLNTPMNTECGFSITLMDRLEVPSTLHNQLWFECAFRWPEFVTSLNSYSQPCCTFQSQGNGSNTQAPTQRVGLNWSRVGAGKFLTPKLKWQPGVRSTALK